MIKRTLFFSHPAYLSTKNEQLVIRFPEENKPDKKIPIEDIGYLVLENQQITLTNGLIMKMVQNKTAIITCDQQHLPCSILQPLVGHTEQTVRYNHQIEASTPLKKQLWQQTVVAKITNQTSHLKIRNKAFLKLEQWAKKVKSGDSENHEAVAAAFYFQQLITIPMFSRNQKGIAPNNLLNYGYAILRAIVARALVSSGLLPSVGIFHHNKYNAFALADDIMEPYRPYVDAVVYDLVETGQEIEELTIELKAALLKIPVIDVWIDHKWSPLMNAVSRTTSSLYSCFEGSARKILYPEFKWDDNLL